MRKLLLTLLLLATPLHAQIQCEALVASQGTCPTGTNCTVKGSALSVDQADAIVRNTARLCLRAAAAADTLASNPELGANETMFSTDGATGGLLFEGSVADGFEGLFLFPDVTGSDQTFTLLTDSTAFAGDVTGTSGATVVSEAGVTQHQGAIDHDALTNFVASEHVAAVVVNNNEYCQGGPSTTLDCDVATIPEADIDALLHRDAEIKDGDLVDFDDANGDFVATDVDSAIEELVSVNGSGPNAVDGKVDWSQLAGVPAGFADGTDDGGGGTPGGADTQVQYNNAGAFGGDADFTWDAASNTLRLPDAGTSVGIGPHFQDANGRFSISGSNGEISLLDRAQVGWTETSTTGQRWVQYVSSGQFRINSGGDKAVLSSGGRLTVQGTDAAYVFKDRSTSSYWFLYADGGNARIFLLGVGDLLLISPDGDLDVTRNLTVMGKTTSAPQTVTCTDSGDASAGALTLTPTTSHVQITNNDANGCDVTMSESGAANGQLVTLTVVANTGGTMNLSDTPGVTELAGAFAMDVWDSIDLIYQVDRWVEKTRSNN